MRRALLIAAFSLLATAAQAEWRFTDVSDDESIAYKGWVTDVTGAIELQYYCDDWFPDAIDLTIYTAETYDPDSSYAEEGTMNVVIDGQPAVDVTAFFDQHEGELLIYTSNFDVDNIGDVMEAMAYAEQSIGLRYYGRKYLFPVENVFEVLEKLVTDCPTE